ncbi:MAG: phosphomethylpyrimidine synthase ThiC, partial [Schwartzia sp.]|nr:phosphomethylpyrimidine synthase ThiC [Schwartzia sp. (in: firmicutes)]
MATQMELARAGRITAAMERVAEAERLSPETIREGVARGRVVICANPAHTGLTPCGVGEGLRVKVNANIGTSTAFPDLAPELEKLDAAVRYGADAVMDLSTGGDTTTARREIISRSPVMVGTVPIYEAAVRAARERGAAVDMTAEDILETIEQQAKDGADFMTIHCGLVREAVNRLRREGREMDVVSRGGAFLTGWMLHNEKENPVYERFDDILDICVKYDVTVSLGDGLRPGCLADATDRAQLTELIVLGELVDRAWARGVQVMVEGPGHMPFDQIAANMKLEKELCHGAPFYVLGPLVTDIAPGYDHITAAIGGTMAAVSGADFLCYVTPAEHLGLPTVADVRDGVIAARIAAHAADVVKGGPGAREWDDHMARARKRLNWNEQFALAVDPDRAKERRAARNTADEDACSMCGDFCAMEIAKRYMEEKPEKEAVLAAAVLAAEDAPARYADALDGYWEEGYHYYLEFRDERLTLRGYDRAVRLETADSYDADCLESGAPTEIRLADTTLERDAQGGPMTEVKSLVYEDGTLAMTTGYVSDAEARHAYTLRKVDHDPFAHIIIRDDEVLPRLAGVWKRWTADGSDGGALVIEGNELSCFGKKAAFHAVSYTYDPDRRIQLVPENLIDTGFGTFAALNVWPDMITTHRIVFDMCMPLEVFAREEMLDKIE